MRVNRGTASRVGSSALRQQQQKQQRHGGSDGALASGRAFAAASRMGSRGEWICSSMLQQRSDHSHAEGGLRVLSLPGANHLAVGVVSLPEMPPASAGRFEMIRARSSSPIVSSRAFSQAHRGRPPPQHVPDRPPPPEAVPIIEPGQDPNPTPGEAEGGDERSEAKFSAMLQQIVGGISVRPAGGSEPAAAGGGGAAAHSPYSARMPTDRSSGLLFGERGEEEAAVQGRLNLRQLRGILEQASSRGANGGGGIVGSEELVEQLAKHFSVDKEVLKKVITHVFLPQVAKQN